MMLLLVALSVAVQVILYLLFRKQKYIRVLILFLFLFFNLHLFPLLYTEDMYSGMEAPHCGMGAVAVYFYFWLTGGSLTLCTHIFYWFFSRRLSLKQKTNDPEKV